VKKEGGKFAPPTSAPSSPTCWLRASTTSSTSITRLPSKASSTTSRTAHRLDRRDAEFYKRFEKDLEEAGRSMRDVKRTEIATDQTCDRCGKPMVIKWGKHGYFLACTGYPECTNTRETTLVADEIGDARTRWKSRSRTPRSIARTAGVRWCSRRGASERSTPVRAIPTARRPSRLAARSGSRTCCSKRSARFAITSSRPNRPLWRVHGLLELPGVQVRAPEDDGRSLPQVRYRRTGRAALQARQDVLRVQPLPGVRLRGLVETNRRALPELRVHVPAREVPEVGSLRGVPEQGMQVPQGT